MQILKSEIKNKILEAAVEEFLINGYSNSSLRTIAAQAGITVGNIYSYFSSKDDLFEHVVAPARDALNILLSLGFTEYESKDAPNLIEITNNICQVFIANKERFFILMNGSSGSKFENMKQDVEDFISGRIQTELYPAAANSSVDPLFSKALSSALLSSFLTIFNHYGGDEKRLLHLIHELLYVLLGNIRSRL